MPEIAAKTICLVRLSAMGDVIHSIALANGLRRGYPDAHITWIVEPLPFEVVREQTAVDRFIVFKARGGLKAWRELRAELSSSPFDLLVLPQVSFKANMVAALATAKVKLGFDRGRARELHSLVVNETIDARPLAHAQEHALEFLDRLGISREPIDRDIVFTPEELEEGDAFFRQFDKPVVSFVIATARESKNWPAERYAHAVDEVERTLGCRAMLIGGPSEREQAIAAEIVARTKVNPVLSLDKPVRTMLVKLRGSAVVVSPDTGPLHAAVAMNRPTVGLYGFTDPRRCGPWGKFGELVVDHYAADASSAVSRRTKEGRMLTITTEEVVEKIALALQRYR